MAPVSWLGLRFFPLIFSRISQLSPRAAGEMLCHRLSWSQECSVAVSLAPFLAYLWPCSLFLSPSFPSPLPFLPGTHCFTPPPSFPLSAFFSLPLSIALISVSLSFFPFLGPLLTILGTQAHILRKARPRREAIVGVLADRANRSAHDSQQQELGYNLRPSGDPSPLSARFPTEPSASMPCLA